MPSTPGSASPDPSDERDWAAQVASFIERVVGTVRDMATRRALTAVRAVVYGILAAFLALMALILFAIIVVRVLEVYLPIGGVWLPDLIVGMTFVLMGLLLWSRMKPSRESA